MYNRSTTRWKLLCGHRGSERWSIINPGDIYIQINHFQSLYQEKNYFADVYLLTVNIPYSTFLTLTVCVRP